MSSTQNDRAFLLRYHEIALKGDNRGWFEERLAINCRKIVGRAIGATSFGAAATQEAGLEVHREHGRVFIRTDRPEMNAQVEEALKRVFGAVSYSPVRIVATDKDAILKACVEEVALYVEKCGMPKTFRVFTKRSDKAFPEKSFELDRLFGSHIHDCFPQIGVQLDDPELIVGIEIRNNQTFIWTRKVPMGGGLPVGSNGRTLALISGGLDSPVAAIQVLRRGSPVSFVHFHGTPYVGNEVLEKIEDLVRIVNRFHPEPQPLHVVPFGKIQEKIALVTQPKLRTVIYRRMMLRIAAQVAKKVDALALVTGESLGQVASQTLENMATIDAVAKLPVLRPLITLDKDQIIAEAQRWGTYETSIRPADDCCTLFADRHPATRATPQLADEQEAQFPVEEFVQEAMNSLEVRRIRGNY